MGEMCQYDGCYNTMIEHHVVHNAGFTFYVNSCNKHFTKLLDIGVIDE